MRGQLLLNVKMFYNKTRYLLILAGFDDFYRFYINSTFDILWHRWNDHCLLCPDDSYMEDNPGSRRLEARFQHLSWTRCCCWVFLHCHYVVHGCQEDGTDSYLDAPKLFLIQNAWIGVSTLGALERPSYCFNGIPTISI